MTRSRSHAERCCHRQHSSFFGGGQVGSACSERSSVPQLAIGKAFRKAHGMGSRWQHSICSAERRMAALA